MTAASTDTKVYDSTTSSARIPTVTTGSLAGTDTALHADLRTQERRHRQDTDADRHRQRRQRWGELRPSPSPTTTTGVITARAVTVPSTAHQDLRLDNDSAAVPTITAGTLVRAPTPAFTQIDTKNVGRRRSPRRPRITDGNGGANYDDHLRHRQHRRHHPAAITVTGDHRHQDLRRHHQLGRHPDHHRRHARRHRHGRLHARRSTTPTSGTGKTLIPAGTVNDGNGGANYAVTFVDDTTGVITQWAVTVTADSGQAKIYGTPDPALTYTVTGSLQPR